MESNHFSLSFFILSIGFFIYGLRLASETLKLIFSDQLRAVVRTMTQNPALGFVFGFMTTLLFQSSVATRALLIGFANVGIVSLERAIPVLLGADLSISVLSFVFAIFAKFNLLPFSQSLIIFGIVGHFLFKKSYRNHGKLILSLGFVFYGLSLMGLANAPLRDSEIFQIFIESVLQQPMWAFLLGFILTSFLQSSVIVLGILVAFSYSGLIPVSHALPFVLGVNLGSSVVVFLAAAQAQNDGRLIAYINILYKCAGTLLIFPIYPWFAKALTHLSDIPPYQIVWGHVIYNLFLTVLFIPFTKPLAKFMRKKFPNEEPANKFHSQFLDVGSLDSATIAFANVSREISRMAAIVEEMCKVLLRPFEEKGRETMIRMDEMDDQVDQLDREIKFYLARIQQQELNDAQSKKSVELLMFTNNLESVGDIINRNMMVLVEKKKKNGITFTKDSWSEIVDFHGKVIENFKLAVAAFVTGDIELGKRVLRNKKFLTSLEQELGQHHLSRLRQLDEQELIEALSLFLDVLSNLRLINSIICKMAYPALDRRQPDDTQPILP
ncbi:MAG: Na/Pi cotransporter family protein [Proteobacteria bacterium]|jgi:phosphate:Na+ symporter|nr:Na/Pi cotransporter family protein [Pseudomonadota bacterium]